MLIASEAAMKSLYSIIDTLEFIENDVLNIGLFLVTAVRFFQPEMDDMFLMSLKFVDGVYKQKHPESNRNYYGNLIQYHGGNIKAIAGPPPVVTQQAKASHPVTNDPSYPPPLPPRTQPPLYDQAFVVQQQTNAVPPVPAMNNGKPAIPKKQGNWVQQLISQFRNNKAFAMFLQRSIKRSIFSIVIFMLSGTPIIGRFITAGVSFYSFHKIVGTATALAIFAIGLSVERRYMIIFLSTFWGGRSLVRGLLAPYFTRVPFTRAERDQWFKAREGIMFGFGCGFYWILKIPFVGVLGYGIAEASAAYLITKVSEPLPPPGPELYKWVENEMTWTKQNVMLSGATLNTDGFGDAVPIIPGGWAS